MGLKECCSCEVYAYWPSVRLKVGGMDQYFPPYLILTEHEIGVL